MLSQWGILGTGIKWDMIAGHLKVGYNIQHTIYDNGFNKSVPWS